MAATTPRYTTRERVEYTDEQRAALRERDADALVALLEYEQRVRVHPIVPPGSGYRDTEAGYQPWTAVYLGETPDGRILLAQAYCEYGEGTWNTVRAYTPEALFG